MKCAKSFYLCSRLIPGDGSASKAIFIRIRELQFLYLHSDDIPWMKKAIAGVGGYCRKVYFKVVGCSNQHFNELIEVSPNVKRNRSWYTEKSFL